MAITTNPSTWAIKKNNEVFTSTGIDSSGGGEVESVNNKKGVVVLKAEDIDTNAGATIEAALEDTVKKDTENALAHDFEGSFLKTEDGEPLLTYATTTKEAGFGNTDGQTFIMSNTKPNVALADGTESTLVIAEDLDGLVAKESATAQELDSDFTIHGAHTVVDADSSVKIIANYEPDSSETNYGLTLGSPSLPVNIRRADGTHQVATMADITGGSGNVQTITTQLEADTWIDYVNTGANAYETVILKTDFTANHPINLEQIGTKNLFLGGFTITFSTDWITNESFLMRGSNETILRNGTIEIGQHFTAEYLNILQQFAEITDVQITMTNGADGRQVAAIQSVDRIVDTHILLKTETLALYGIMNAKEIINAALDLQDELDGCTAIGIGNSSNVYGSSVSLSGPGSEDWNSTSYSNVKNLRNSADVVYHWSAAGSFSAKGCEDLYNNAFNNGVADTIGMWNNSIGDTGVYSNCWVNADGTIAPNGDVFGGFNTYPGWAPSPSPTGGPALTINSQAEYDAWKSGSIATDRIVVIKVGITDTGVLNLANLGVDVLYNLATITFTGDQTTYIHAGDTQLVGGSYHFAPPVKTTGSKICIDGDSLKNAEVLLDLSNSPSDADWTVVRGTQADHVSVQIKNISGLSGNHSIVGFENVTGGIFGCSVLYSGVAPTLPFFTFGFRDCVHMESSEVLDGLTGTFNSGTVRIGYKNCGNLYLCMHSGSTLGGDVYSFSDCSILDTCGAGPFLNCSRIRYCVGTFIDSTVTDDYGTPRNDAQGGWNFNLGTQASHEQLSTFVIKNTDDLNEWLGATTRPESESQRYYNVVFEYDATISTRVQINLLGTKNIDLNGYTITLDATTALPTGGVLFTNSGTLKNGTIVLKRSSGTGEVKYIDNFDLIENVTVNTDSIDLAGGAIAINNVDSIIMSDVTIQGPGNKTCFANSRSLNNCVAIINAASDNLDSNNFGFINCSNIRTGTVEIQGSPKTATDPGFDIGYNTCQNIAQSTAQLDAAGDTPNKASFNDCSILEGCFADTSIKNSNMVKDCNIGVGAKYINCQVGAMTNVPAGPSVNGGENFMEDFKDGAQVQEWSLKSARSSSQKYLVIPFTTSVVAFNLDIALQISAYTTFDIKGRVTAVYGTVSADSLLYSTGEPYNIDSIRFTGRGIVVPLGDSANNDYLVKLRLGFYNPVEYDNPYITTTSPSWTNLFTLDVAKSQPAAGYGIAAAGIIDITSSVGSNSEYALLVLANHNANKAGIKQTRTLELVFVSYYTDRTYHQTISGMPIDIGYLSTKKTTIYFKNVNSLEVIAAWGNTGTGPKYPLKTSISFGADASDTYLPLLQNINTYQDVYGVQNPTSTGFLKISYNINWPTESSTNFYVSLKNLDEITAANQMATIEARYVAIPSAPYIRNVFAKDLTSAFTGKKLYVSYENDGTMSLYLETGAAYKGWIVEIRAVNTMTGASLFVDLPHIQPALTGVSSVSGMTTQNTTIA